MAVLTRIDDLLLGDHFHLREEDECYFLGEYTPRGGYAHSATNNFISNFKKSMSKRGTSEWPHKLQAIVDGARELKGALSPDWLGEATLVPMPPSKARGEPEYDDRLVHMLRKLGSLTQADLDIRELIYQSGSTRSSSQSGDARLTIGELRAVYRIDEDLSEPPPESIGLFDDVVASGKHFRVAKDLLQKRWPRLQVTGIFLARSIH